MTSRALSLLILVLLSPLALAKPFDHSHEAWSNLLEKHVVWLDGVASQVDYAGIDETVRTMAIYLAGALGQQWKMHPEQSFQWTYTE